MYLKLRNLLENKKYKELENFLLKNKENLKRRDIKFFKKKYKEIEIILKIILKNNEKELLFFFVDYPNMLIKNNVDLNIKNKNGLTLLSCIFISGNIFDIKYLKNIKIKDNSDKSNALKYLINLNIDNKKSLLLFFKKYNFIDKYNLSLLSYSIFYKDNDLIEFLLENNIKPLSELDNEIYKEYLLYKELKEINFNLIEISKKKLNLMQV